MPISLDFIYRNIARNQAQLKNLLEQLALGIQNEHEALIANFLCEIEKSKDALDVEQRILNLSIVYTDHFRKLVRKVHNLILDKNIYFGRNDQIVSFHSSLISEDEQQIFRHTFAKICDYSTKGNDEMKLYQDPKFCSYILSKTFKKTFNEVIDFLAINFDMKVKERIKTPIKIVSIGGGPGNDGLAIAAFIRTSAMNDLKIPIFVNVLDLNAEAWKKCAFETVNKFYSNLGIEITWEKIDHTKSYEMGNLNTDFISICWTLNEQVNFNLAFWTDLVKQNCNSVYLVIEGDCKNIDMILDVFLKQGLDFIYYEKFANPRRLFAYKTTANNEDQIKENLSK